MITIKVQYSVKKDKEVQGTLGRREPLARSVVAATQLA